MFSFVFLIDRFAVLLLASLFLCYFIPLYSFALLRQLEKQKKTWENKRKQYACNTIHESLSV